MDAGRGGLGRMDQCRETGVVGIRIVADDSGQRRRVALARLENYRRGARAVEQGAVATLAEETDVTGHGALQSCDPPNGDIGVADQLAAQAQDNFAEADLFRGIHPPPVIFPPGLRPAP